MRHLILACVALAIWLSACPGTFAQDPSADLSSTLHGTVINSATREPIGRALVFSPDNHFATMTDPQGRFEFAIPSSPSEPNPTSSAQPTATVTGNVPSNRPYMLAARKPGYLVGPDNETQGAQISADTKEVTIELIPEALIVGHVALPTSEAPDKIAVELYRREIQDGRAHWVSLAVANSTTGGEYRFAELTAGTYKLLTHELADSDAAVPVGQQYAYIPAYFPNAPDFAAATEIQLTPGKIFQADLSITRHPYFPIRIPVTNVPPNTQLNVMVSMHGRHGPGYALEYNPQTQRIEGSLPDGTFVLEVSGSGTTSVSGSETIVIRGAPVEGPALVMSAARSINVDVKEEFSSTDAPTTSTTTFFQNGRSYSFRGSRGYLNLQLQPADDFGNGETPSLRQPKGPGDEAMVVDGVQPGRYWVRLTTSRGYASSVIYGSTDLQHAPLVVGVGGSISPIEITMRDDTAQVDGFVEGAPSDPADGGADRSRLGNNGFAHVYCIPADGSSGQYTELPVSPDGKIFPSALPPGAYRVLAFKQARTDLEYRNPEAMRLYDGRGPIVRLVAGQTEHLRIPLISGE